MSARQPITHEQAIDLASLYVLDALEEAEMASVREHLATCPESHAAFDELGGVVPYLLEDPGLELVEPPASLGDRIMAAAAADLAARSAPVAEPTAPVAERPIPAAIPFPPAEERAERAERTRARTSPFEWAVRIAAVVAIVALGAWSLRLQGQVSDLENQVAAAERFRSAVATVLDIAVQKGSQTALLEPVEAGGPRGLAAVASDGSIQFAMEDLAPTSGSQVYETWAIVGEDAPVPLGSFTVDASGIASFTSKQGPTDPGIVVAVSREPAAGATSPTEVVSAGAATAPST
ncbi:MAG TPA: anti-sigma factor [Candidatus Limnocylindrales bacterium]|nr:anti-sigma factor [Candidatus Limnocylindrales bacterium]